MRSFLLFAITLTIFITLTECTFTCLINGFQSCGDGTNWCCSQTSRCCKAPLIKKPGNWKRMIENRRRDDPLATTADDVETANHDGDDHPGDDHPGDDKPWPPRQWTCCAQGHECDDDIGCVKKPFPGGGNPCDDEGKNCCSDSEICCPKKTPEGPHKRDEIASAGVVEVPTAGVVEVESTYTMELVWGDRKRDDTVDVAGGNPPPPPPKSYYCCKNTEICDPDGWGCKPKSGACRDPKFYGFDGEVYFVKGEVGKTYAIISDEHLQVNSLFSQHGMWYQHQTFMTEIGIGIGSTTQIQVHVNGTVTVNRKNFYCSQTNFATEFYTLNCERIQESFHYRLSVPRFNLVFNTKHQGIMVNMQADFRPYDEDYSIHGLLGQTADKDGRPRDCKQHSQQGEGCIDGVYTDYEVSDLFAADFKFNKFEAFNLLL